MKSKVLVAVFTAVVMFALAIQRAVAVGGFEYAVTTDWHGIDVPSGQLVVATAETDDPGVKEVNFVWKNPDEEAVFSEEVSVSSGIAESSYRPDEVGDWGVQAIFYGTAPRGNSRVDFVVRATSLNLVPETPWGPAAIAATFLAALGFFVFRKRLPSFRAHGIR